MTGQAQNPHHVVIVGAGAEEYIDYETVVVPGEYVCRGAVGREKGRQ